MKWVELDGVHVNMDPVGAFTWCEGWLRLRYYNGSGGGYTDHPIRDPDKRLYLKMCRSQGIRPAEEVIEDEP